MSVQELLDIIKDDEFANVTFSGGDPLYQVEAFTELARRIKEETGKSIWCYTGFTYEQVLEVKSLSRVQLFATPWTVAYQAPLSMGFSRQEHWSGLPFPSPGDLPDPGIEPGSPAL